MKSLLSRVRRALKKSKSINGSYRRIRSLSIGAMYIISPVLLAKLRYRATYKKWPNLENPGGFDEKLNWLNLYWRHPLKTQCGDKYAMRSYVKDCGYGHILPRLLGVYENSNEIDFGTLPQRFVLKCTHGCGFNVVCQDKSNLDIKVTKRALDKWMKVNFSRTYGELHYADMKPRIICEEFLDDLSASLPSDYKVFCFAGKAHCIMACTGRSLNGRANYDIYDLNWTTKLPYSKTSLMANRKIAKPVALEEILAAAEVLSKPFPFVRMDFYDIKGKVVIGEMTFTPAGCVDINLTDLAQNVLGELIKLPNRLF